MYGIFINISPKNHTNIGKYTIRGAYGNICWLSISSWDEESHSTRFNLRRWFHPSSTTPLAKPRVADEFLTSREYDPYLVALTRFICSESDLGGSIVMGVPQNGWFIVENPLIIDENWGYPHVRKAPFV